MKSPVVILHTEHPDAARAALVQRHSDLEIHTCDSYAALPEKIRSTRAEVVYSVRFAGTPDFPRAALLEAPSVKWVAVGGSGTDHLAPWDTAKLTVTNAAGVAADMMAQYALGAMLYFSLGLQNFRTAQQQRSWLAGKVEPITGKSVLILGLGKTGMAVAARAKALDMTTIGVRARPQPTAHVDETCAVQDLPHLWPRADFIIVCAPLLPSTRALVGKSAFAAMQPTAVLVDMSRGGVVDESSLVAALENNRIRGAVLDVFATEPLPKTHRLWSLENVLITPHCSSVYDGWELKSVHMFADNLTRYRNGEPLTNIVDPQRGY